MRLRRFLGHLEHHKVTLRKVLLRAILYAPTANLLQRWIIQNTTGRLAIWDSVLYIFLWRTRLFLREVTEHLFSISFGESKVRAGPWFGPPCPQVACNCLQAAYTDQQGVEHVTESPNELFPTRLACGQAHHGSQFSDLYILCLQAIVSPRCNFSCWRLIRTPDCEQDELF